MSSWSLTSADEFGRSAYGTDRVGHQLAVFRVEIEHIYPGAGCGEHLADAFPDPAGASRDESCFVVQTERHN
jgi:hypothetical protein